MYLGSKEHKANARSALKQGKKRLEELKTLRIEKYNTSPTICKQCNNSIEYKHRRNKFCSSSCAATFNNKGRTVTEEHKLNTSITAKKNYKKKKKNGYISNLSFKHPNCIRPKQEIILSWKIKYTNCKICDKLFVQRSFGAKVTCSEKCCVIAKVKIRPYQNGSRKTTWYFNSWQNKNVLLESSWEVRIAKFLDLRKIKWERPDPIKWIDVKGKNRLYFPDFYLNDYNTYLDPKNPYCIVKDKEKLLRVTSMINLIYGDVKLVENYIVSLNKV